MQEIKLIIFFILTLCTFVRYKKYHNNSQSNKIEETKVQSASIEQVVVKIEEPQSEQKLQQLKAQTFLLSEDMIQKFVQVESSIIAKQKVKRITHNSQIIRTAYDINDILGGQYPKCKEGKTFQMDSDSLLYNTTFKTNQSPFTLNQGNFSSNQVLFENLRIVLENQRNFIDQSIILVSTLRQNESSLFQNFTYNILNEQELKMDQQENLQESEALSDCGTKKKLKKKKILKSSKRHIKLVGPNQRTLDNVQKKVTKIKQKLVRPSKSFKWASKKSINLKELIKQKEIQLSILKKLYYENDF